MNKIASILLILLLSPVFGLLLIIGLFNFKSPLFLQNRTGKDFKTFGLIKFRSIPLNHENPNKWGVFIRRYSLDELPQIFNVLKGEMNFIGPRPLLPEYDNLYTTEQKMRFLVKPGITGWAQIKGRNNLSWEDQFRLDVWYVENQTFWLDCKIIVLTFLKILHPKKEETKIRAPFDGNN